MLYLKFENDLNVKRLTHAPSFLVQKVFLPTLEATYTRLSFSDPGKSKLLEFFAPLVSKLEGRMNNRTQQVHNRY